jgi:hypothetical protein
MPLPYPEEQNPWWRNQWWLALGAVLVCAAAAAGLWWWWRQPVPPPARPIAEAPPAPAAVVAPPVVEHPIEATAEAVGAQPAAALPPVDESDASLRGALVALLGASPVQALVQSQGLARRIVATLDNLPRDRLAANVQAWQPAAGRFTTTRQGEDTLIGADNAARYAPAVRLLEATDTRGMVGVYVRYYPMLQRAYQDLGYPNRSLNNRVVEVIDHLLAAPEPPQPVRVVQPKVNWVFADPQLEALSAGQKLLVRMGPDHERAVKTKLREIRRAVTSR